MKDFISNFNAENAGLGSQFTALAQSLAKTAVQLALEGTDKNADEIVAEIKLNDSDVQELLCCFLGTSDQCFTGLFERTYPYIYYDKDAYKQYKQLSKF